MTVEKHQPPPIALTASSRKFNEPAAKSRKEQHSVINHKTKPSDPTSTDQSTITFTPVPARSRENSQIEQTRKLAY